MKAQIYINRHVVAANKKATLETGEVVDNPAISVNTYLGSIYCKQIDFFGPVKLIQDATSARCSGATIWMEVEDISCLVIDGNPATKDLWKKTA